MTGIALGIFLEVVLMIVFGDPERTRRRYLCDNRRAVDLRSIELRDQLLRDLFLIVIEIENGRTIGGADIVALAVSRGGIVDLEKELQQLAIRKFLRIKDDLDALGMRPMVAIGGIGDIAAGITDRYRNHSRKLADQLLHTPKTPAG